QHLLCGAFLLAVAWGWCVERNCYKQPRRLQVGRTTFASALIWPVLSSTISRWKNSLALGADTAALHQQQQPAAFSRQDHHHHEAACACRMVRIKTCDESLACKGWALRM
ncbi:unnamed protein product, partial [Ectocarpus sp. 6 AP-2014]